MRIADNQAIKAELENLQLQFGNRAMLTLDDYAELYGIKRKDASRHLRRRNIHRFAANPHNYTFLAAYTLHIFTLKVIWTDTLPISIYW